MRIKTIALAAVLAVAGLGLSGCHGHPGHASDHRGGHHGDHDRN